MALFDASVATELLTGMRLARQAVGRGELIVIPTDTVYGVAADAFTPAAVQRLLDAKGRDRTAPPPVLIPGVQTLEALAETVTDEVRALAAEFWPGGLTIVVRANPALDWDLGETRGTVALRVPSDAIALELLAETGPLAVSSANLTGRPAATTAAEAQSMLGDAVSVYLDGGPVGARYAASASGNASDNDNARAGSTIVDATALTHPEGKLRIVRHGVIPDEAIIEIVGADRCA